MRRCKQCKTEIKPAAKCDDIVEKKGYCSVECLAEHARSARRSATARKERKAMREARERVKTRQEWLKEAQAVFNKYIRLRDANDPCISCGRYHDGQYHAGHYRTVGAAGHLRFDEDNNHKQCSACNLHLSGNIANYRPRLLQKIGEERLAALENNNESRSWTIEDAKQIKAKYKAKIKALNDLQHSRPIIAKM